MSQAAVQINDDAEWDRVPTALEAAHYDDLLRRSADAEARRRAEESERARVIFGECLLKLVKLGLVEGKARSMLGKWRGQAKDDQLLIRIINHASSTATPDPISYITKALKGAATRVATVETRAKGKWELIGWEKPRMLPSGPKYRGSIRGQVWRDPFGKMKILPPEGGTVPPGLEDEPGVELDV